VKEYHMMEIPKVPLIPVMMSLLIVPFFRKLRKLKGSNKNSGTSMMKRASTWIVMKIARNVFL
jgi:hypothetical protein